MPSPMRAWIAVSVLLASQGCVAKTVVDVATLPVKAASQTVDWVTTSQDEADRNRSRELRRAEERYGELQREQTKQARKCQRGDQRGCAKAQAAAEEMESIQRRMPPR